MQDANFIGGLHAAGAFWQGAAREGRFFSLTITVKGVMHIGENPTNWQGPIIFEV
jgi:hypothetical protein